jgi:glycine oxidase
VGAEASARDGRLAFSARGGERVADAIVIGGGVMGLAMARELRRGGRSVTLLERATPGRAASWASAGIIGATVRHEADPSYQLRRLSEQLWPRFAEALQAESGLDPEYRLTGCLYLAESERELGWLQGIAARAAPAQGADTPELLDQKPDFLDQKPELLDQKPELLDQQQLRDLEPALAPSIHGALKMPGGNVEPRRLCRALEIAARRAGVELRSGTTVQAITRAGDRVSGVETADGRLEAEMVVLAAGAWSSALDGVRPRPPVRPQRGQILALDQAAVGLRHVLLTPGDPYFVPRCDGRLVVGATREEAGWDASLTAGGVAWLLDRAMAVVPKLRDSPIAELWTGFRPLSEDGLPLIGASSVRGLYFLTGHGPSGISPLPGSIALLSALIAGESPPIAPEPFDPLRFERTAAAPDSPR